MATIVIAEPDFANASIMQATLEGEGHTVQTAQDGYEALSMCEKLMPDMVLLAVNLSVMTGPEVSEALRNDPDFPAELPIILLHSEAVDQRVVERCGATETMEKGVDTHRMRERVVALLGPAAGAG